jgi:hypothetical protein
LTTSTRVSTGTYAKLDVANRNWFVAESTRQKKQENTAIRNRRKDDHLRKAQRQVAQAKEERDQEAVAMVQQMNVDIVRMMRSEEREREAQRDLERQAVLDGAPAI